MANAYDPSGVGQDNGNFLGLPIINRPAVVFVAVPFDATVSYRAGTQFGPANILAASLQLDVCVPGVEAPWELGFAWQTLDSTVLHQASELREVAAGIIGKLEAGLTLSDDERQLQGRLDDAGSQLADDLRVEVSALLRKGQFPLVIGGEHAISLGAFQACAEGGEFGILQVDAHMDLRPAYEGFRYSHASIMHNALELPQLTKLVQVGIRDWSPVEEQRVASEAGRIEVFYDHQLQRAKLEGTAFAKTAANIVEALPQRVWVSFDIDGLDPSLCANTGTPVPGGLSFAEAQYVLQTLIDSGRTVVGLDIVETAPAPYEFEGAVAARLAYFVAASVASRR